MLDEYFISDDLVVLFDVVFVDFFFCVLWLFIFLEECGWIGWINIWCVDW